MSSQQRLVLWAPVADVGAGALSAAFAAGDVAAAVLEGAGEDHPHVELCQGCGVAAFVTRAPVGRADGLHAGGEWDARLAALAHGERAVVGAEAATKHEAMELGERGAHYVWFGAAERADGTARELAAWWSALFEVPAVVAGAQSLDDVPQLLETGAEFIAIGPALIAAPAQAQRAVSTVRALIEGQHAA